MAKKKEAENLSRLPEVDSLDVFVDLVVDFLWRRFVDVFVEVLLDIVGFLEQEVLVEFEELLNLFLLNVQALNVEALHRRHNTDRRHASDVLNSVRALEDPLEDADVVAKTWPKEASLAVV